jgi:hypothetical protein
VDVTQLSLEHDVTTWTTAEEVQAIIGDWLTWVAGKAVEDSLAWVVGDVIEDPLTWVAGEAVEDSLTCVAGEVIVDVTQMSPEHDLTT